MWFCIQIKSLYIIIFLSFITQCTRAWRILINFHALSKNIGHTKNKNKNKKKHVFRAMANVSNKLNEYEYTCSVLGSCWHCRNSIVHDSRVIEVGRSIGRFAMVVIIVNMVLVVPLLLLLYACPALLGREHCLIRK